MFTMSELANFGFVALWNPDIIVLCAILIIGYYALIKVFVKDIPGSEPVSIKQQVLFILGVLVIYIGKGSPVYLLGHILFSIHMVEMTFVYLLAPPLLIMGIPHWAYESMLKPKVIRGIFTFLTRPVITLLLFNALFTFYHFPMIFDFIMASKELKALSTLALFFAAILMWWPILNPLPDNKQLSDLRKVGYIILNGILLTPACAYLFLSSTELYQSYNNPNIWATMMGYCLPTNSTIDMSLLVDSYFGFFPPLQDQKFAGVLMKVLQEVIYVTFLIVVFVRWVQKEKKTSNKIDPLPNA